MQELGEEIDNEPCEEMEEVAVTESVTQTMLDSAEAVEQEEVV